MDDLAGELRRVYDDAPRGCRLVAIHLFALRRSCDLKGFRRTDLEALAARAGIGRHGGELWTALFLSEKISFKFYPAESKIYANPAREQSEHFDFIRLSSELLKVYNAAPAGEREAALLLFGIKHAERLRKVRLSTFVTQAGLHKSAYWIIRKGRKLADYVNIIESAPHSAS